MYDLVLKNAKLINNNVIDVAIKNGKISEIGKINDKANHIINLKKQVYISAGWIDAHTHCFINSPIYHDEPDLIGIYNGVTSIVDAGSVGALDIEDFYFRSQQAKTNVYAFLNISKIGLIRQNELANINDIDIPLFNKVLSKYPDFILGIKVRMSRSVVGENGILPLLKAKEIQKQTGLPIMVHIGNNPPELDDIADLLTKGDIITHCFNGKPNKIFDQNNLLRESIKRAINRGVILDIGHGSESFSFEVAEHAKKLDIYPNTISSDIYSKNRLHGPVFSLANIMTKFISMGYSLEQIIDSVTYNVAKALHLKNKGRLATGYDADITIFNLVDEKTVIPNTQIVAKERTRRFMPLASIVAGYLEITEEGHKHEFTI